MKYWNGSRVEAEGRMARSEGGASPKRAATTERRGQLPFCLAPATVALILALASVAPGPRSLRISALRFAPWPTPKSTATRPIPVFQQSPKGYSQRRYLRLPDSGRAIPALARTDKTPAPQCRELVLFPARAGRRPGARLEASCFGYHPLCRGSFRASRTYPAQERCSF